MKHCSTLLTALIGFAASVNAQYCSPTFQNGCFNWNTMSVSIGTLAWALNGDDCSLSDQTALTTSIVAGEPTAMAVESGVWCGCAVWVDLDGNGSFEDTENLYTIYVGGSPSHIYDFDLTIPAGTPAGSHRMRVISPWGSDGVSVGDNGYGPCGDYQYGNFEDFILNVTPASSIRTPGGNTAAYVASPNPTNGRVKVSGPGFFSANDRFTLEGIDGRAVGTWTTTGAEVLDLDLGNLPAGTYVLRNASNAYRQPLRLVKL